MPNNGARAVEWGAFYRCDDFVMPLAVDILTGFARKSYITCKAGVSIKRGALIRSGRENIWAPSLKRSGEYCGHRVREADGRILGRRV
jgi:hypothetical protein